MRPEQWEQIKSVFETALGHGRGSRADALQEACRGDPEVLAEVESLLAAYEEPDILLDKPLGSDSTAARVDPMTNRRVGPYRIVRRLGHGGMADVYLGVRADKLYQRFVAIKLIKAGLESEEVLGRFRHERHTLAVLDHPNIVKLLDAGIAEDGRPYLVMDYVQGQSIDEYCDSHRLSVAERLGIIRTICAAVHYAHQNLVVHRDLKPTNVLVTVDGVPKLLDFGIAKLLRPEYSGATIGMTKSDLRPMTPEYASPEQVKGEPITTATDVYSLGVLIYQLLTGLSPYRVRNHSALDYAHAICEVEPERPSVAIGRPDGAGLVGASNGRRHAQSATIASAEGTRERLRRKLRGELDTIVLTAMRKEVRRRYASVEQLSEDIRRYLTGLPVIACRDTLRYRTGKFVRRHTAGVVTALAVGFVLACGIVAIVWQARAAEVERSRAERRFNDVRQLARFVLFDLDEALKSGVTPARRVLIGQALTYLDRLAQETGGASVETDLIEGYLKIGDVQGNLYGPNLGQTTGAEASYRAARRIAEAWTHREPARAEPRRQLARANQKLGELLTVSGDVGDGLKQLHLALAVFEELAAESPADARAKRDVLKVCETIASTQYVAGDLDGALRTYERYVAVGERLFVGADGSERRRFRATADREVGRILALKGKTAEGLTRIQGALAVFDELVAADPTDVLARRAASITHSILGDVLAQAGKRAQAVDTYRTGLAMLEVLASEDPENQQLQRDLSLTLAFMADVLSDSRDVADARRLTVRALQLLKRLASHPDASAFDHNNYAWRLVTTRFADLQDAVAARTHAERAVALTNSTDLSALNTLALAYDLLGDPARAIDTERAALSLLPAIELASETAHTPKELKGNLAKFQANLAKKSPSPR